MNFAFTPEQDAIREAVTRVGAPFDAHYWLEKDRHVPASLIKDQHYSISYATDRSSATVKILDLDRVRDDRVAFAVTQ